MSPLLRVRSRARGVAALGAAGSLVALAVAVVLPATSRTAGVAVPIAAAPAAATSAPHDVIANLFEWNWPSVGAECTDVLGPKGYGAVQVAPPEDSIRLSGTSHAWWDVYQPVGCSRCGHSGYKGRIGLYEVMLVSDTIRSLAVAREPSETIAHAAVHEGMMRLREDGLEKVRRGLTSIAEIARVAGTR